MTKIVYFLYSFIMVLCFLACPKQSETSSSPDLSPDLSPEEIHAVLTKNLGQIKSDKNLVIFLAHNGNHKVPKEVMEKIYEEANREAGDDWKAYPSIRDRKKQEVKEHYYQDILNKLDFGALVRALLNNNKIVSKKDGGVSYEISCHELDDLVDEVSKQFGIHRDLKKCQEDSQVQAFLKNKLLLRVSSLSKDVLRIGIVVANKEFAHLVVAPEKIMLGADVGQSMRDVWAILNDDPKKPGDMGYMRNDLPDDMGTYTGTIQAVYKKGVVSVEFPQGLKRDYAGTHFEIDKSLISFLFEDGSSTVDFGESKYVFGLKRPVTVVTGGSRCKETTTGRPDCTPDQVSVKLSCEDGKKLDTEAPYSRVAPFVSAQFSLKKPVKLNYIEDASNFCD